MHRFLLSSCVFVAVSFPCVTHASTWKIDSAHSSAQFAIRHLMVSTVRGTLGKVTGVVSLDEADPTQSSVDANIDATTIDTREPKRDEHLKSADFFDVAKYPTVTFKSKKVTKVGDSKFQISGDLTLHGVTKEIVLDVDGSPKPFKDPMGNLKLGGGATTRLHRKDFGIEWNKSLDSGGVVLGDDVDVTIDIELVAQQ